MVHAPMIPPLPTEETHKITLKDGRMLAYYEYGAPDGTPLLFFHGTPGSHHLIKMADEGGRKAGFRLIAPDRPGLGDSTFQAGRELFHYPIDIEQLLKVLDIKGKIGVMGISGGAPYSLQCAHDLPERIAYAACLSGWVSYGRPDMKQFKIDPFFRLIGWASQKAKWLLPVIGKMANKVVKRRMPELYAHLYKKLPPADQALFDDEAIRNIFLSDLQNAYKQGWQGVAKDAELQFSTPAYPLSAISQPVFIMHGTADTVVPYGFGEYLNSYLPNVAAFMTVPEGGHLCAATVQDEIFAKLRQLEQDAVK